MKRSLLIGLAGLALACGDDAPVPADTETDSDTDGTADSTDGPSTLDETAGACAEPFECPADQSVQCIGPQTPVELEAPLASCEGWDVVGTPPETLPPGENSVEFMQQSGSMSDSCTTVVTVVDEDPPFINCPDAGFVLRASEEDQPVPPEANADDLCWDELTMEVDPPMLGPGITAVEYTATDGSGNSVSCTTDLEVLDVFAAEGFRIIAGNLTDAGETEVTLAWEPNDAPIVTGYRVETAPAPDGPWQLVDTVGADEQLFTATMNEPVEWYRVIIETDQGDGGTTEPRRAFTIIDELYDIRDVPVPGIPFDTTLYGVVRYPTELAEGPFPLVLVLHGNHGNCRDPGDPNDDFCSTSIDHECGFAGFDTAPNAHGYDYLLDTLSAQGVITVSISGNAMNCRDDYIIERSQLIVEHLRRWSDWQGGSGLLGGVFSGSLDLSRVGLVGHSRGGDAVSNVPGVLASSPIPGLEVESIFAIAPTDFHDVVVRNTDLAVLLPACDGDVASLSGVRHYDRSVGFDDGVEQAQVMFIGANHNYFNTEWRLSEWELSPGTHPFCEPFADPQKREQQGMLQGTLGSWVGSTLLGEPTEAFVRAEVPSPSSFDAWAEASLDLRWSYSSTDRVTIDDLSGPETPGNNDLGGANSFTDWFLWEVCTATGCDAAYRHLRSSLRLLWEQGFVPTARFELAGYDATGAGHLSFRVVSRFSTLNNGLDEQDFFIRVSDTSGAVAQFPLSDIKTLNHLYPHTNGGLLEILETVRIPMSTLLAIEPGLDLSSLEALELEMTALDRSGSVIVTDLEFAQ